MHSSLIDQRDDDNKHSKTWKKNRLETIISKIGQRLKSRDGATRDEIRNETDDRTVRKPCQDCTGGLMNKANRMEQGVQGKQTH